MIDLKFYNDTVRLTNIARVRYNSDTKKANFITENDSYGLGLELKCTHDDSYYVLASIEFDNSEGEAVVNFNTDALIDMPYNWNEVMCVMEIGVKIVESLNHITEE